MLTPALLVLALVLGFVGLAFFANSKETYWERDARLHPLYPVGLTPGEEDLLLMRAPPELVDLLVRERKAAPLTRLQILLNRRKWARVILGTAITCVIVACIS